MRLFHEAALQRDIHSLRGLRYSISHEAAVLQEPVLLAIAVLPGFFIAPSPVWYVAMVGVILVVLAVELLNTAIERLSDHVNARKSLQALPRYSVSYDWARWFGSQQ